jgi:hypothetical protein
MQQPIKRGVFAARLAVSIPLAALLLLACSSTVDEVTNTIDCHSVCKRFADCYNHDYDVDGCTDKCENNADASDARQTKLKQCSNCIDDRSCASATCAHSAKRKRRARSAALGRQPASRNVYVRESSTALPSLASHLRQRPADGGYVVELIRRKCDADESAERRSA